MTVTLTGGKDPIIAEKVYFQVLFNKTTLLVVEHNILLIDSLLILAEGLARIPF